MVSAAPPFVMASNSSPLDAPSQAWPLNGSTSLATVADDADSVSGPVGGGLVAVATTQAHPCNIPTTLYTFSDDFEGLPEPVEVGHARTWEYWTELLGADPVAKKTINSRSFAACYHELIGPTMLIKSYLKVATETPGGYKIVSVLTRHDAISNFSTPPQTSSVQEPQWCRKCKKKFANMKGLKQHSKERHALGAHVCICKRAFARPSYLRRHELTCALCVATSSSSGVGGSNM